MRLEVSVRRKPTECITYCLYGSQCIVMMSFLHELHFNAVYSVPEKPHGYQERASPLLLRPSLPSSPAFVYPPVVFCVAQTSLWANALIKVNWIDLLCSEANLPTCGIKLWRFHTYRFQQVMNPYRLVSFQDLFMELYRQALRCRNSS